MSEIKVYELWVDKICIYFCRYSKYQFSTLLFSQYNIIQPDSISRSVLKRQAEFFFGRYVARHSLKRQNIFDQNIGIGSNRMPLWPNGIVGSISHTDSIAICTTMFATRCSYLGIDIEKIMDRSISDDIQEAVLSFEELIVLEQSIIPLNVLITLAFSAKESLFKALYPCITQYLDFHDAKIVRIDKEKIILELVERIAMLISNKQQFYCHYVIFENNIVTLIAE